MSIGLFELAIGAALILLAIIWKRWPRHKRHDLDAPPSDLSTAAPPPEQYRPPEQPEVVTAAPIVSTSAKRGAVRNEADYSEDDLMMRDARALLHRDRKIEAVARVRRTRDISLADALALVEAIEMPDGIDEIRYK